MANTTKQAATRQEIKEASDEKQSCETCVFLQGGWLCRLFKRRKAAQDGNMCSHYYFKSPDIKARTYEMRG